MSLKVFNSLTRCKEEFIPLHPPVVDMYVCGVTPYDEPHLGHARAYVTFDVVKRYLRYLGYKVLHAQNYTDIDDKIIKKSAEHGVAYNVWAQKNIAAYEAAMHQLGVLRPSKYLRATEYIGEMIEWIMDLIETGFAYVIEGDVYFEVDKFKDYGKLSGRNLEDMRSGARVEIDQRKKSPLDFALWKTAKAGEPFWESPWGKGRPGWHIECSVMSSEFLGKQFDIHGGGLDLEFPHHENEIAQAEAHSAKKPWVKYWMHNGFVNINKQKMSKSLGNFFALKDIFQRFDPMAVRLFLLQTHYRSPINYSDPDMQAAQEAYQRLARFARELEVIMQQPVEEIKNNNNNQDKAIKEATLTCDRNFTLAMNDDFNTAGALAAVFELVRFGNTVLYEKGNDFSLLQIMLKRLCDEILGICLVPEEDEDQLDLRRSEIEPLLQERAAARKNKDYKRADEIRVQLKALGAEIEDTPTGLRIKFINPLLADK